MSGPDPFEKLLTDYVSRIGSAWAACEDRTSPLGELAAEAAALLQFYLEWRARPSPKGSGRAIPEPVTPPARIGIELKPGEMQRGYHWSDSWKKEWRP